MRKTILQELWSCAVQKNCSKKHQIFEKWDNFENGPFCKDYSPCKGYSLCKMVSLGQKLKIPKTCEKTFFKIIRVIRCKNPLWKTPNIREMRQFSKSPIFQRPLQNGQFGSKIKNTQKHAKNHSTRTLQLFCAKNRP